MTIPFVGDITGVVIGEKISIPLWVPDLPQGSCQNVA
jgi:hypothetical protein